MCIGGKKKPVREKGGSERSVGAGASDGVDPRQVVWKRCVDMNDRVLRNIVVGLGRKTDGMVREDHFVITVASEIMAILCLADVP